MQKRRPPSAAQHGTSMIEVLVTIVILTFGLLGLAGLQSRLHVSEIEAYQRAQALVLLEDMENRITTNRSNAASYVTGTDSPLGAEHTCSYTSSSTLQQKDVCQWSEALQGAGELSGNSKVGALIGGRGCVENLGNNEYLITVAWQGMSPASTPPSSVACGQNLYDGGSNSSCTDDRCRRVATTVVRIGTLSAL